MATLQPRWVVGRTIAAVEMRPLPDGRGNTTYHPLFILDNGARISFVVDETESLEYGITPLYIAPQKGGRRG